MSQGRTELGCEECRLYIMCRESVDVCNQNCLFYSFLKSVHMNVNKYCIPTIWPILPNKSLNHISNFYVFAIDF